MNLKLLVAVALVAFSFQSHGKGRAGSNDVYFAAAQKGDVASLQNFFATDTNSASLVNELLRAAVLSGQKDTTEYLLSEGADVNGKGFSDLTPLGHLAMYGIRDDAKSAEVAKVLIAHGATIDPVDQYKGTPLMHAVESQKSQMARVLLEHGANLMVRFTGANSGKTLLHMAVYDKDKDMVAVLLEFKAPVDAVDRDGATPLSMAEGRDETEILAMLRAANPEAAKNILAYSTAPTKEEMRALAQRIAGGDDAALDELASTTAKLYKEIKDYQKERERVMLLLGRMHIAFDLLGAEAGKGNDNALQALKKCIGPTGRIPSFAPDALAIAAAAGNKEALDILIHYQAWNILDSSARFALARPTEANIGPAVNDSAKWLLSLSHRERDSGMVLSTTSALAAAAAQGNQTAKEALEKFAASAPPPAAPPTQSFQMPPREAGVPEHWSYLIGDPALLNRVVASPNLIESRDDTGETPLLWAVKAHQLVIARTLLEHGAKIPPPMLPVPDNPNLNGYLQQFNREKVPLLWAVTHEDKEMVRLLVEFKASLEAADQDGKTPLHYAVERNSPEMVQLLLDLKAPVNAAAKNRATPLMLAETTENEPIARMLRDAGAEPVSSAPIPSTGRMRAIALRICAGDAASFDELAKAADDLYAGLDVQKRGARERLNNTRMGAAFDVLAEAAAKNNDNAFQALKKCLGQTNSLKGFAPYSLGKSAAAGHAEALDILVNYQQWGIHETTAYFSLEPAAKANLEPAVDMFVSLVSDPVAAKKHYNGMAWMVKEVLQSAAAQGNQKAQEALDKLNAASDQAKN